VADQIIHRLNMDSGHFLCSLIGWSHRRHFQSQ
jgi:hypothetical protein